MEIRKHIPNLLILVNALCGVLACYFFFQEGWQWICILIIITLFFDLAVRLIFRQYFKAIGRQHILLAFEFLNFACFPILIVLYLPETAFSVIPGWHTVVFRSYPEMLNYHLLYILPFLIPIFWIFRLITGIRMRPNTPHFISK